MNDSSNLSTTVCSSEQKSPLRVERPRFRSKATETGLELSILVPGVPRDALKVSAEGQQLSITGERSGRPSEERRYDLRVELHDDLDPTSASARHENGVLTLTVSKREELKPRTIDILAN